MGYKYVLFDLDGTLINTNNLIIDSFKYTYKTCLGLDVCEEDILKCFGEPLKVTLRRYSEEKADELFNTYIEYNEVRHNDTVTIFEGIPELLPELVKRGSILAVVTAKRRKVALMGLELFDIRKYFDVIVALEDTELHKPNPAPVIKALEILGANASETLMVGDSVFDIHSAHGASVAAALVKWSAAQDFQDEASSADYVVHDTKELLKIITE
ncbi:MAG: HAD-IA family hydrolase [Clostridiaceae bacterium]|nr:HAD-IA family hydrolase [Clostridiaceae bacterium]